MPRQTTTIELTDPDDLKLVTLARGARGRTGAVQGAAIRDTTGRTYAAATVELPSLRVSAVGVAVAMAVSSGSTGAEAVVVLGGTVEMDDVAIVRDFAGKGVPVYVAEPNGTVESRLLS